VCENIWLNSWNCPHAKRKRSFYSCFIISLLFGRVSKSRLSFEFWDLRRLSDPEIVDRLAHCMGHRMQIESRDPRSTLTRAWPRGMTLQKCVHKRFLYPAFVARHCCNISANKQEHTSKTQQCRVLIKPTERPDWLTISTTVVSYLRRLIPWVHGEK